MSLPVKLKYGYVSIYGAGSVNEMILPNQSENTTFSFGVIDQRFEDQSGYSVGDSVLYNRNDAIGILYVDTTFYVIPEEKIILLENQEAP